MEYLILSYSFLPFFMRITEMKPYIIAVGVVIAVAIGGRLVMADEAPPQQVQQSADAIADNQKEIARLKPLVEKFELLKSDNAKLVGRMEAFGWTMDWATKQPVKLPLAQ